MTIVTPFLLDSGRPTESAKPSAAAHLSDEQVEELGRELDALRESVIATRGAKDAAYIRRVIATQRSLELAGRATLLFAKHKPAWIAGTGIVLALAFAVGLPPALRARRLRIVDALAGHR